MAVTEWEKRQQKVRRIEREKAESMRYYEEHREEIETRRKATLILLVLIRWSCEAAGLDVDTIIGKCKGIEELNFYYAWCCFPLR